MPLDQRVEDHHKLLFSENFLMVTQRLGSKLRPFVTEQQCTGEGANVADLIGTVNYQRGNSRRRSNIENVPERTRRWLVYRDPIETGQYLDSVDKFRMIDDPTSKLYETHVNAIRRGVDDTILGLDENGAVAEGGIFGKIAEGKRPGNAGIDLPSSYQTAAGGTGLTIPKLRAARKKLGLDENDLDMYRPCMAITTNQHDNLLGIVESASGNLNMLEQPTVKSGKVTSLMGFDFIEINRLPKQGTTRRCPIWLKDKVVLGVWQDVKPDMWNDTHARNTPYMHCDAYMDATRIEDLGIHVIECEEA